MIHHGGMRARGERAPALFRSTMMNHGVVSNHVISDNVYLPKACLRSWFLSFLNVILVVFHKHDGRSYLFLGDAFRVFRGQH